MYDSITPMLYRKADAFVLVYDITNRSSFKRLTKWMDNIEHYQKDAVSDGTKIMLIGNKADLEEKRAVTCEEGRRFAKENRVRFFEASAKTGANVNEAFEHLVNQLEEQTKFHDTYKRYTQSVQLTASTNIQPTRRCSRCSSSASTQSYEALHNGRERSHASSQTTEASFVQCQSYAAASGDDEIEENPSILSECMYSCFIHIW